MDKPNIIIIVLDTLRKDYSNRIEDKLTKKFGFTAYENAITPSPWTIPSHASMFTGLYPIYHGIHESKNRKVPNVKFREDGTYLHEVLASLGYTTYLFTANLFVGPDFGINGFFKFYDTLKPLIENREREELERVLKKYQPKNSIELLKALMKEYKFILPFKVLWRIITRYGEGWPKDKGLKVANELLDKLHFKIPLYIFINLMEVHEPYSLFEGFTDAPVINRLLGEEQKLVEKWRKGYQKQVKYLEKGLIDMLNILQEKKILENSIIIVTSDHGQLLGEYEGKLGHGLFLHDELLRVPFLIRWPDLKPREIENGYISLTRIKSIILNTLQDKEFNFASEYAIAESFGTHYPYPNLAENKKELIQALEKYRIKLYHKNGTAIFNIEDWHFEEIDAENEREFLSTAKKILIKHLSLFAGGVSK